MTCAFRKEKAKTEALRVSGMFLFGFISIVNVLYHQPATTNQPTNHPWQTTASSPAPPLPSAAAPPASSPAPASPSAGGALMLLLGLHRLESLGARSAGLGDERAAALL